MIIFIIMIVFVPVPPIWWHYVFLCFILLETEYLWVLDCLSDKKKSFEDVILQTGCKNSCVVIIFIIIVNQHICNI